MSWEKEKKKKRSAPCGMGEAAVLTSPCPALGRGTTFTYLRDCSTCEQSWMEWRNWRNGLAPSSAWDLVYAKKFLPSRPPKQTMYDPFL
jgi:hypothetical protein